MSYEREQYSGLAGRPHLVGFHPQCASTRAAAMKDRLRSTDVVKNNPVPGPFLS